MHPGTGTPCRNRRSFTSNCSWWPGYDKYFQIARCLRDEDLRADRQPEFTQLDLEMSFVEMEDIFRVIEKLTADVFTTCIGVEIPLPLPRLKYADAMLKYGSDKPDLRYGLEIVDIGDIAAQTEFQAFRSVWIRLRQQSRRSRPGAGPQRQWARRTSSRARTSMTWAKSSSVLGGKGCAWVKVEAEKFAGGIEKFLPAADPASCASGWTPKPATCCCSSPTRKTSSARRWARCVSTWPTRSSCSIRTRRDYKIAWVYDFPSFIWDDEEKRWAANHHPFTAPMDEDLDKLESDPGSVRAKAYDLVINGYECGGGSIRIHNPEVQARLFKVLGMSDEQARQRFGFLLDALQVRRPAARRHRPGPGPLGHDARPHHQHPRRHRLPQEPESPRSDDRMPGAGGCEAIERTGVIIDSGTVRCFMPSPFPGMNPYLEQDDAWQDFHDSMIPAMRDALVAQVGSDYVVKIEHQLFIHEPPHEERHFLGKADVGLAGGKGGNGAVAVAPILSPIMARLPSVEFEKHLYLEIRDKRSRELVTAIELLSPTNKKPGADREQYLAKRATLLASPVHFVEIDLLRGWERMPIEKATPCDYCIMVSRVESRPDVNYWPLKLRDTLPKIPVPLRTPDPNVELDLQAILHSIYDRARYGTHIYGETPYPPLGPEDSAWAASLIPPKI